MKPQPRCPVAGKVHCSSFPFIFLSSTRLTWLSLSACSGCPKILQVGRVVCDALLPIEIEEMRSTETAAVHSTIVEDFTEVDDEWYGGLQALQAAMVTYGERLSSSYWFLHLVPYVDMFMFPVDGHADWPLTCKPRTR